MTTGSIATCITSKLKKFTTRGNIEDTRFSVNRLITILKTKKNLGAKCQMFKIYDCQIVTKTKSGEYE